MKIGINLDYPVYWYSGQPFANLLEMAGPRAHPLGSWAYRNTTGYTKPGDYLVCAEGTGTLRLLDSDIPPDKRLFQFGPGEERHVVTFVNQANSVLEIVKSDPSDPIRDIKICPVEVDPSATFHPHYVEKLKGAWALRSVHWYWIEGDKIGEKAGGKDTTWETANPRRWEQFLELCNLTGARPWINLPHCGDEGYSAALGDLVRTKLDPDLKPIVEYSNEVWNSGYPWVIQMNWIMAEAIRLGVTGGIGRGYPWFAGRAWDAFEKGYGKYATRVLAGQFVNWGGTGRPYAKNAREDGIRFDAFAAAPYPEAVGGKAMWELARRAWEAGIPEISEKLVLDPMFAELTTKQEPHMRTWQEAAESEGVPLLAYEWGQSILVPRAYFDPTYDAMMQHVQRSSLMGEFTESLGELMGRYFAGGCHYEFIHPNRANNYFGLLDHADDDTPKWRAWRELVGRLNV